MKGTAEMIEAFPFTLPEPFLEKEDFTLLASAFRKVIRAAIPGCGSIYFLTDCAIPEIFVSQEEKSQSLALALGRIFVNGALVSVIDEGFLFAFRILDESRIVVFIDDVDSVIIQRAAEDWLLEIREHLVLKFLECKQNFIDPETGLLNSAHLFGQLQSRSNEDNFALLLVELPPKSRLLREAFRNAQRAAAALKSFCVDRFLLHNLGQNVYALLSDDNELRDLDRFSASLVHYLKRENFFRVHIGSSQNRNEDLLEDYSTHDNRHDGTSRDLLKEAWTALQEAGKRGPFSFCDFRLLVNAHKHPLRVHRADILRRFRKLSIRDNQFCLIKLSILNSSDASYDAGSMELGLENLNLPNGIEMKLLGVDRGILLYVSGANGGSGLELAHNVIDTFKGERLLSASYAGVSCFPYRDFSRLETLKNVQKALLHAEFFGPGHAVLFDAVSLNISGDIYFSDGDLPNAIKDYKLGLKCDSNDVNLLNSLGVTYALMNRDKLARCAFMQALEIDSENYMAHYNLGLGAHQRGDVGEALEHFTAAHSLCEKADQQQEICCDLRLQLGKLCCKAREYEKSIHYLALWTKSIPDPEQERALRYLGEAYLGLGKPQRALPILQKALRQNPFDAEVMSMLGESVLLAGEGNDIALSFCAKAVALDPQSSVMRMRLAKVQYHLGENESALSSLKRCRGGGVDPIEVQLYKALAYAALNQKGRARNWAEKVVAQCEKGGEFHKKAGSLIASL